MVGHVMYLNSLFTYTSILSKIGIKMGQAIAKNSEGKVVSYVSDRDQIIESSFIITQAQ